MNKCPHCGKEYSEFKPVHWAGAQKKVTATHQVDGDENVTCCGKALPPHAIFEESPANKPDCVACQTVLKRTDRRERKQAVPKFF